MPKANTDPTFEQAIERLEAIVEQMESDKLPLEQLMVRYEEGIKLIKLCGAQLAAAEKRIEIVTRDASGAASLSDFEAAAKPEPPAETSADVSLF